MTRKGCGKGPESVDLLAKQLWQGTAWGRSSMGLKVWQADRKCGCKLIPASIPASIPAQPS